MELTNILIGLLTIVLIIPFIHQLLSINNSFKRDLALFGKIYLVYYPRTIAYLIAIGIILYLLNFLGEFIKLILL